jgi:hypothetical protein
MNIRTLGIAACVAWGGLALSTAATANAYAATTQTGNYALCFKTYYTGTGIVLCNTEFPFRQNIRFTTVACNTSGCIPDDGTVYVEVKYAGGRTHTTWKGDCSPYHIYSLASCAC